MTPKTKLRSIFKKLRASLSEQRRKEASLFIFEQVQKLSAGLILSFDSFGSEINLTQLNQQLCFEKRLILTKVEEGNLNLYLIEDLSKQLELTSYGFRQPIPSLCRRIFPSSIDLALIPGIAFDHAHFRLGYGKGYYDRLLVLNFPSIGVGFKEQKCSLALPRDPWNIPLQKLLLG